MRPKLQLSGMRFGRLQVGEPARSSDGKWRWNCVCDCGVSKEVLAFSLKSGTTKSCGCLHREMGRARAAAKRRPGLSQDENHFFTWYKNRAQKTDLAFDLTVEQFLQLIRASCYFCGDPPSRRYKTDGQGLLASGIDRLDSSQGYTAANSRSCCYPCNQAKSDFTEQEFLDLCRRVSAHPR